MFSLILFLVTTVLPVQPINEIPIYNRKDWGNWTNTEERGNNNCIWDTRNFILRRDSIHVETVEKSNKPCRVITLTFMDPYSNQYFKVSASSIDIDHIVPVSEVHRSGGANWSQERKNQYYNYLAGLTATLSKINRTKGDKDPSKWLPEYGKCEYVQTWVAIKIHWSLSMDLLEITAIADVLKTCSTPILDK